MFANRVVDSGRNATARMQFALGTKHITIQRSLRDLSLMEFSIDGEDRISEGEDGFKSEIAKLANVSSFGDWILLLRYLTFYFEDRRALVWDPTAQREILRILFLTSADSSKWSADQRKILELDSRVRNLNNTVNREERDFANTQSRVGKSEEIRKELAQLEQEQQKDSDFISSRDLGLLEFDDQRQKLRLRLMSAEQDREAKYRAVERIRYLAIEASFPSQSEISRYIYAQIIANQDCIVCGNHVPQLSVEMIDRIEKQQCVVCGSKLDQTAVDPVTEVDISTADTDLAINEFNMAVSYADESRRELEEAESNYQEFYKQSHEITVSMSQRALRIEQLVSMLPPQEADIHRQHSELAMLRARRNSLKDELEKSRNTFAEFIEVGNREISIFKDEIKESFGNFAEGFLLEQCQLTWSPQKAIVGQTGRSIEFPSFELDMTGVNFPSLVRRNGPDQVSESQREFIDLAFRMALMAVSAKNEPGTLVMDAPESSLDAVFSSRAADVLSRFATPSSGNRLVITSNLVEGQLIPQLIKLCIRPDEVNTRVVDLLEIATPTAAVRELRQEYQIIHDRLLKF